MPTYSRDTNALTARVYEPPGATVAAITQIVGMATGDLDLNDTFDIGRLPAGSRVLDVIAAVTDMDTGSTGTIHIGDAGDPDRFISGGSIQAAGVLRAGNNATAAANFAAHTRYTAETLIYGTVAAAPTGAQAGTITVTVLYTVED
jgi:hypothetical protein